MRRSATWSAAGIEGDIVECGVWRGGSSMMAALAQAQIGLTRRMWLYDTFEGMPPPSVHDVRYSGEPAAETLDPTERIPGVSNDWAWATVDDVRSNMRSTGHSDLEFVVGQGRGHDPRPSAGDHRPAASRHRLVRIDPPRTGASVSAARRREASSSSTTTDTGRAHGRRWTNTSARVRSFSIGSITPAESRSSPGRLTTRR